MKHVKRRHDLRSLEKKLNASDHCTNSEQRLAVRLGRYTGYAARERLETAPECLSVRHTARVLGCGKTTVRRLLDQELLHSRRIGGKRRMRGRQVIPWDGVRDFIAASQRWQKHGLRPLTLRRPSFLERFIATTSASDIRIPAKLTIAETAVLLGCSCPSVLRMLRRGELIGFRRTPHRWLILKASFRKPPIAAKKK